MKVSRKNIVTLFIFVMFILIETISFATYQGTVQEEEEKRAKINQIVSQKAILTQEEQETLNLINEYRKQNGLNELKTFSKLQDVAKLKAYDIVSNEYFAHTSSNLGTPFEMLEANNIEYSIAGENLAGNISPKRAVDAWINSTSHRENILEAKFEYSGICIIDSPVYGKVFVQLFVGFNK